MKPRLHKLDNEVSEALKEFINGEARCKMQLAPPHIHWQNAAERAIRTFKEQFIAVLRGNRPGLPNFSMVSFTTTGGDNIEPHEGIAYQSETVCI